MSKKCISRKFVLLCTLAIIISITIATYFIYDQINPVVCNEPVLKTIDVHIIKKIHTESVVVCDGNAYVSVVSNFDDRVFLRGNGKCAYIEQTCKRSGGL